MILRKLQKTVKGSFTVTLPKALILALGIETGAKFAVNIDGQKIILAPVHISGLEPEV